MRPIKFRAWDIEAKVMHSWNDLLQLMDLVDVFEDESLILEEFTGLQDEDGKEIYESDILLTETNWKHLVRWVSTNKECGWSIHCGSWLKTCAIIGNIHENPELLK